MMPSHMLVSLKMGAEVFCRAFLCILHNAQCSPQGKFIHKASLQLYKTDADQVFNSRAIGLILMPAKYSLVVRALIFFLSSWAAMC